MNEETITYSPEEAKFKEELTAGAKEAAGRYFRSIENLQNHLGLTEEEAKACFAMNTHDVVVAVGRALNLPIGGQEQEEPK